MISAGISSTDNSIRITYITSMVWQEPATMTTVWMVWQKPAIVLCVGQGLAGACCKTHSGNEKYLIYMTWGLAEACCNSLPNALANLALSCFVWVKCLYDFRWTGACCTVIPVIPRQSLPWYFVWVKVQH